MAAAIIIIGYQCYDTWPGTIGSRRTATVIMIIPINISNIINACSVVHYSTYYKL